MFDVAKEESQGILRLRMSSGSGLTIAYIIHVFSLTFNAQNAKF